MQGKKTAFTLAEVLITLGIIGFVAAIVIPKFVENANAIAMSHSAELTMKIIEEATMQMKTEGKLTGYTTADQFVDEFQNYVKVAKRCTSANLSDCFISSFKTADGTSTKDTSTLTTGDKITDGTMKTATTGVSNVGLVLINGTTMLVNYDPTCQYISAYDNTNKGTGCLVLVYDVNGRKKPNQVSASGASSTTLASTMGTGSSNTKDIYLLNAAISGCDGYEIGSLCVAAADEVSTTNVASSQAIFDDIVTRYGFPTPQTYGRTTNYWIGAIAKCEGKGMKLPTKAQMATIYQDACDVPIGTTCANPTRRNELGFSGTIYWTSTKFNATYAYRQVFTVGGQSYDNTCMSFNVRCIKE